MRKAHNDYDEGFWAAVRIWFESCANMKYEGEESDDDDKLFMDARELSTCLGTPIDTSHCSVE